MGIQKERRIWFPARTRLGWGWDFPITWPGRAFLVGWIALLMFGVAAFRSEPVEYGGFVLAMIAMLLAVCYAKGERPRWSWGDHRR